MNKVAKRPGRKLEGMSPLAVNELKSLAEKHGGLLRAADIVEAAKSEDSILHSRFEWDDTAAAERFRLVQARALISVCVQYVTTGKSSVPTKVFVSLSTDRTKRDGEAGYRTLVEVIGDDDLRNQMLMDSLQQMTHFQEKYKNLQELRDVFLAMDKAKKEIKK